MPSVGQKLWRKLSRALLTHDPAYEDTFTNLQGKFFAPLYLERIQSYLTRQAEGRPLRILDAGCQVGRLAIPLAEAGHQVTAVDPSRFALRVGERYARRRGLRLTWIADDIASLPQRYTAASFDVVLCAEVLYLNRDHETLLRILLDLLAPGGLACISHRPKLHYIREALQHHDYAAARFVLEHREGPFRGDGYYNWQTADELRQCYAQLPVQVLGIHPIAAFHGLVDVPALSDEERHQLLDLERAAELAGTLDCARYLLVVSQKRP